MDKNEKREEIIKRHEEKEKIFTKQGLLKIKKELAGSLSELKDFDVEELRMERRDYMCKQMEDRINEEVLERTKRYIINLWNNKVDKETIAKSFELPLEEVEDIISTQKQQL